MSTFYSSDVEERPFQDETASVSSDDGYYTPSNEILLLLGALILLVAAAVGISVFFSWQYTQNNDSSDEGDSGRSILTPAPISAPVMAPPPFSVTGPVSSPVPAPTTATTTSPCLVCGSETSIITLPDAVPVIPNQPPLSCADLESSTFDADTCTLVQSLARETCGCADPTVTSSPTVAPFQCSACDEGSVSNPQATVDLSSIRNDLGTVACADLPLDQITETQCPSFQLLTYEPCGCARTQDSLVAVLETVVSAEALQDTDTAEALAMDFLFFSDYRFQGISRQEPHYELQDLAATSRGVVVPPQRRSLQTETLPPENPDNQVTAMECKLCGTSNATATALDTGMVDVEGVGLITCATLQDQLAALNMEDNLDECLDFQALAQEPCGCSASTDVPSQTPTVSAAPSQSPTYASAAPSFTPITLAPGTRTLSSLSDAALKQRYLLILWYYQTSRLGRTNWRTNCAPVRRGVTCVRNQVVGIELGEFFTTRMLQI